MFQRQQLLEKIVLAGNSRDTDGLMQIYDEIKQKQYRDFALYNELIFSASFSNYALSLSVYQRALTLGIDNFRTHLNMLRAASYHNDFAKVEEAFQDAFSKDTSDHLLLYNHMITAAGNCHELARAKGIYDKLLFQGISTSETFNAMIQAASKCDNFALAVEIYQTALDQNITDATTHLTMINAAGFHGSKEWADVAYTQAQDKKQMDKKIHGIYKTACDRLLKTGEEKVMVPQRGFPFTDLDINNVNTFIYKARDFNTAVAKYNEANEKGIANYTTHFTMLKVAGNYGQLSWVKAAYEASLKTSSDSHHFLYNAMITAAGKCKDIDLAYAIFQKAVNEKVLNATTYLLMIKAAASLETSHQTMNATDNEKYKAMARDVYEAALRSETEQECKQTSDSGMSHDLYLIHDAMITTMGKLGDIDTALSIYEKITLNEFANNNYETHDHMMKAAIRNGRQDLLKAVSQKALRVIQTPAEQQFIKHTYHAGCTSLAKKIPTTAMPQSQCVAPVVTSTAFEDPEMKKAWVENLQQGLQAGSSSQQGLFAPSYAAAVTGGIEPSVARVKKKFLEKLPVSPAPVKMFTSVAEQPKAPGRTTVASPTVGIYRQF